MNVNTTKISKHAKRARKVEKQSIASVVEIFDCKNVNHLDKLPGLKKVEVSPLAQKFVSCRIGEDITTCTPWVFVDKEKLEDHLEFYEENSDFFPIMDDIKNMLSEKILIGTYHYNQEDSVEFYVCLTLEVQELIVNEVEKEKQALHDKLLNLFTPKSRIWESLGSETQVDYELNNNMRPLIVIDLEGCMPLHKQKIQFVIENAENMKNGYVELLTTRTSMDSIMRKRIDMGVQASPVRIDIGIHAMSPSKSNKSIQYKVELKDVKLTKILLDKLQEFVLNKFDEVGDLLKLNFSLDLYYDDYKFLVNTLPLEILAESTEIKSYQDVINCRRRKISSFTWNAIVSGVVAAGHACTPIFYIEESKPSLNIEYDTVFSKHYILVWHYNNNVQPKLYLHASRDVSVVSFCPYDENILVAGYNNGQIAVWDLTDKLVTTKIPEFRTDIEQNNHLLIEKETQWFKPPLPANHVRPVLCCSFEDGHCSPITAITWIPPTKYIASQRLYKDSDENEPHMQFLTASLDGYRILVWDLFIADDQKDVTHRKRFARLSTKPAALITDTSPLDPLKKNFKPVCQLIIKQLGYPVTSILVQNQTYNYTARNIQTLDDIDQLTYFNVSESNIPFDYSPKLFFTTGIGTFHEATWEPSDYDPKYFAIDERCQIEKFPDIHDGPILVCETNPSIPNVILTIGGSVFAIWYITEIKSPLFWRKNQARYLTGMWCLIHPLSLLVVRNDAQYEIWNIFERTDLPLQIFKYKGYKLINVYKDMTRSHARKNTCVITDTVGAFKLCTVPSEAKRREQDLDESLDYLNHLLKIKETVALVKENFCKKQKVEITPAEEKQDVEEKVPEKIEIKEEVIPEPVVLTQKMKWQINLEARMRKVLYEKKKINLKKIEKNKIELQKMVIAKNAKANNVALRRSKRDEIFKKAKDGLLKDEIQKPRAQSKINCTIQALKEAYVDDYNNMEKEVIKKISHTHYYTGLDWPKFLRNSRLENICL